MDNSWVNKWRDMASKVKFRFTLLFISVLLITVLIISFSNNDALKIIMVIVTIIVCTIWILALSFVKVRTRTVDDSTICFYSGFRCNVLLINGRECDRAKGSNDYLYAQLPDGRQVLAKQSNSNGEIKIIIGKDNESNLNIL